jgi:DNA-binding MarR family transcriptional regulator
MSCRPTDISQLEALNYVFLRVMGQIFLSTSSNATFNEMTGAQKRIMYFLDLKGPQNMSQIARLVGCKVPATTPVVDKLVKSGLVGREANPDDRRVIRIAMTPKGRRVMKQLKAIHEGRLEEILCQLDPARRKKLISAFEQIHEILGQLQDLQCS